MTSPETGKSMAADETRVHGAELFRNHLWESLNAAAKILLFAVATPLMLTAWGKERFGLFAIANSCVALMVFLDFGIRTLARVGLSRPDLSEKEKAMLHGRLVCVFVVIAALGLSMISVLALTGCWQRWLNLPEGGGFVIASTSALAAVTMVLQLLLEPIAASGRLSTIKAATFAGNLLGLVTVLLALRLHANVPVVALSYFASLALPLVFLLPQSRLRWKSFFFSLVRLRPPDIATICRSGAWINVITGSWLLQGYLLVFLISWVSSPAEAGKFFLFLKLSEFLSVLGASASEPTIAAIASAHSRWEQQQRLATGYRSAVALCLAGGVGYAFFCGDVFRFWLGIEVSPFTGTLVALFGVLTAFGRMITAASLGLARPRLAALGALGGAIVMIVATVIAYGYGGPSLILGVGAASGLLFIPAGIVVSRQIGSTFRKVWLESVFKFLPSFFTIAALCFFAALSSNPAVKIVAIGASAIVTLFFILPRPRPIKYDTQSRRSAFVMRAIDLLNPWRKPKPFQWTGRCVVSSAAGLGDLFIHLPLIAGFVNEARRRGLDVRVALRPAHTVIGEACGWNIIPFDNALEDFFKNPAWMNSLAFFRDIAATRRCKIDTWLDLTGNAVSALVIKLCGVRRIAARTTRGGRSFIDHPLPHTRGDNEYRHVECAGALLGCATDHTIFLRLRGQPLPGLGDTVVLCLTTVCRWRSWPLQNFLTLIDRFPYVSFVVTGLVSEVVPEERATLEAIISRPNVSARLDDLSMLDLIRLIAHARAVITNDTSTAHIANGFRKSGAVLFGPASPDRFGADYGLRNFVDRSCPLHPCVQWTCGNQANWCMRKISAAEVGDHLATLLEIPYAAATKVA